MSWEVCNTESFILELGRAPKAIRVPGHRFLGGRAERLLGTVRQDDLRVPTIVYSAPDSAAGSKPRALQLDAASL